MSQPNIRIHELVDQLDFFAPLSPESALRLIRKGAIVDFRRDEAILADGEELPGLYVLLAGSLKTSRFNRSQREQIFRVLEPGDVFGLEGINDKNESICHLIAREAGRYLLLPFRGVRQTMQESPEFSLGLLRMALNQRNHMCELAYALSLKSAAERVAVWVARQASKQNGGLCDGVEFRMPISKQQLAAELGTVREVVTRVLGDYSRKGVLAFKGRRINVLNAAALRASCGYPEDRL